MGSANTAPKHTSFFMLSFTLLVIGSYSVYQDWTESLILTFFQIFSRSAIKTKNFEHSQNLQAWASIAQRNPLSGDIPRG